MMIMTKNIIISCIALIAFKFAGAQTFISRASVEYEVKTNMKKTLGDAPWAEMMKDRLPNFVTSYYTFSFADGKSRFAFSRWEDKNAIPEFMRAGDETNSWYMDHEKGVFNMQKNVFGSNFDVMDSIPHIQWKLSNESRVIAGFNCRKAVGIVMDSVYVFAFYTEEIMIPGGPCSINGLPGLILGMTIPRLYSSWIATKVSVTDVNEGSIKPVTAKKYLNYGTLRSSILDRVREWGEIDDPSSKQWIEQFLWKTFL